MVGRGLVLLKRFAACALAHFIAILNRKPGKDRWMLFTHFTYDTGAKKRIEASKKLEAPIGKGR